MGKGSYRHPLGGKSLVKASWLIYLVPMLVQVGMMRTIGAQKEFIAD